MVQYIASLTRRIHQLRHTPSTPPVPAGARPPACLAESHSLAPTLVAHIAALLKDTGLYTRRRAAGPARTRPPRRAHPGVPASGFSLRVDGRVRGLPEPGAMGGWARRERGVPRVVVCARWWAGRSRARWVDECGRRFLWFCAENGVFVGERCGTEEGRVRIGKDGAPEIEEGSMSCWGRCVRSRVYVRRARPHEGVVVEGCRVCWAYTGPCGRLVRLWPFLGQPPDPERPALAASPRPSNYQIAAALRSCGRARDAVGNSPRSGLRLFWDERGTRAWSVCMRKDGGWEVRPLLVWRFECGGGGIGRGRAVCMAVWGVCGCVRPSGR